MIQSLEISNFQSHRQTNLEFDPGLNIIVGTSDSGKSAILRSLRWVVQNRPSGDSLRSWWGGKSLSKITFDNGSIERIKDKTDEYLINDKTSLKAFGLTVPDEVSALHNFSEINLQAQMDRVFLFDNSPGEVAAYFNKVAGLDKIDRAQQNVEKEIRSLTADIKYKTADQEKLQTQLEGFDYLEKYEIRFEVLEEMENKKLQLTKNVSKFIKLYNSLVDLENEIEEASEILKHEDSVNNLFLAIALREKKIIEKKKIEKLRTDFYNSEAFMRTYQFRISFEPALISLSEKIESRKTLFLPFTRLKQLVKSLNGISISLEEDNRNLELQTAKFKKEMPDVCPLCDSPIKK